MGYFEHGNEPLVCIKDGIFPEWMVKCQLVMKLFK